MFSRNTLLKALCGLILLTLLAIPAGAAKNVVSRGIDLWMTPADGSTFVDFSAEPLPRGFFCRGSAPFDGKILFMGSPVVTSPPEAFGRTDTIVERLDDAVFDQHGVAYTRIQVRALSFAGLRPIKTSCGAFEVRVVLDGEQPVTDMFIFRDHQHGGRFEAPISVNVRTFFTPIQRPNQVPLEISQSLHFAAAENARWADGFGETGLQARSQVAVDTDGSGRPDSFLRGSTPDFAAGLGAPLDGGAAGLHQRLQQPVEIEQRICHLASTHEHCTTATLLD